MVEAEFRRGRRASDEDAGAEHADAVGRLSDDVDDAGALECIVGRSTTDGRDRREGLIVRDIDDMRRAELGREGEARVVAGDRNDFVAGELRAAMIAASPTVPTPNTTTLDPGVGRAVLKTAPAPVDTPQASGPIISNGTSGRTATSERGVVNA